jgi:hypothetical protein
MPTLISIQGKQLEIENLEKLKRIYFIKTLMIVELKYLYFTQLEKKK